MDYDEDDDQDHEQGVYHRRHRDRYDEEDYGPRHEQSRHRGRGRDRQKIGVYSGTFGF